MPAEQTRDDRDPGNGADAAGSMVITGADTGELVFSGSYLPTPEREGNGPPYPGPTPPPAEPEDDSDLLDLT